MPRTATTFFQTQLFPHLPGIDYYGLPYTQINPAFNRMLFEDESTFDQKSFNDEIHSLPGERVLLSNENFVGQSLFWHFGNRTRIADRLHAAMPEATIILFLRNQPDLLKSLYLIALQDTEHASIQEYLRRNLPEYSLDTYRSHPRTDLFDYAPFDTYHTNEQPDRYQFLPLVDLYKKCFPKVHVLLYEDFQLAPEKAIRQLCEIMEVSMDDAEIRSIARQPAVNSGTGARQAAQLRALNRWYNVLKASKAGRAFYVRAKRHILRLAKSDQPLRWTSEEMAYFKNLFSAENAELHTRYPEIGLHNHSNKYMIED